MVVAAQPLVLPRVPEPSLPSWRLWWLPPPPPRCPVSPQVWFVFSPSVCVRPSGFRRQVANPSRRPGSIPSSRAAAFSPVSSPSRQSSAQEIRPFKTNLEMVGQGGGAAPMNSGDVPPRRLPGMCDLCEAPVWHSRWLECVQSPALCGLE